MSSTEEEPRPMNYVVVAFHYTKEWYFVYAYDELEDDWKAIRLNENKRIYYYGRRYEGHCVFLTNDRKEADHMCELLTNAYETTQSMVQKCLERYGGVVNYIADKDKRDDDEFSAACDIFFDFDADILSDDTATSRLRKVSKVDVDKLYDLNTRKNIIKKHSQRQYVAEFNIRKGKKKRRV